MDTILIVFFPFSIDFRGRSEDAVEVVVKSERNAIANYMFEDKVQVFGGYFCLKKPADVIWSVASSVSRSNEHVGRFSLNQWCGLPSVPKPLLSAS